jgi:small GTP-binding protein
MSPHATPPILPHFDHGHGQQQQQQQQQNGNGRQQQPHNGGGGGGLDQMQKQQDKIKCVFLGDGAVGKTSLIISYTTNGYPSEYVPTAIDTYDVVVHVDGEPVTFEMCDTPGQDDFDTLRPLCYANTDVFLVCFSVVGPSSFQNVKEKWMAELKRSHKDQGVKRLPPVILVGTQSDLREDAKTLVQLARAKEQPVSEAEARKLASSMGFECYVESSSLTQRNLKEVFDEAIMTGLRERKKREKRTAKKKAKRKQGKRPSCLASSAAGEDEVEGGGRKLCTIL